MEAKAIRQKGAAATREIKKAKRTMKEMLYLRGITQQSSQILFKKFLKTQYLVGNPLVSHKGKWYNYKDY